MGNDHTPFTTSNASKILEIIHKEAQRNHEK